MANWIFPLNPERLIRDLRKDHGLIMARREAVDGGLRATEAQLAPADEAFLVISIFPQGFG